MIDDEIMERLQNEIISLQALMDKLAPSDPEYEKALQAHNQLMDRLTKINELQMRNSVEEQKIHFESKRFEKQEKGNSKRTLLDVGSKVLLGIAGIGVTIWSMHKATDYEEEHIPSDDVQKESIRNGLTFWKRFK